MRAAKPMDRKGSVAPVQKEFLKVQKLGNKHKSDCQALRKISVGSDCSGYDGAAIALEVLGVPFKHVFASEILDPARSVLTHNHVIGKVFVDATKRDNTTVDYVDAYSAGFPCQPFSSVGQGKGTRDPRGKVGFSCTDYITKKKPKCFILENVSNLTSKKHCNGFEKLLALLKAITGPKGQLYNIYWTKLNTADYGIPQNRSRVYVCGVQRELEEKSGNNFWD